MLTLIAPVRAQMEGVIPPGIANAPGQDHGTVFQSGMTSSSEVTITTQPASLSVASGSSASFSVVATGTGTLTYQWFKDGEWIDGANSATYSIAAAAASDAGLYTVEVRSGMSKATSAVATLSVANAGVVTTAPGDQTVAAGANATFSVATSGTGLTFQWLFNGDPISGATMATYTVSNAGANAAGVYTVDVSDTSGLVASESANLTVNVDARLSNLSIRGFVDGNWRMIVVGLAIGGTGQKEVLLRADGPALATFGVTDFLPDPVLTLYGSDHSTLATNAGWGGTAALSAAFTQVGAFALPATSADSAMLQSLSAGTYSATITGASGSSGVALAEIYDADTGTPRADLVNLSARAHVADGAEALIAGFVITGTTSETILIRGVGPTLGGLFGFGDALADTRITLFDSTGAQVAVNAGWDDDPDIDRADDRVGAFHFMEHSRDSALLVTLAPGMYTVELTGDEAGENGTGMVEIYQLR